MHTLILLATATPTPSPDVPGLRPGLTEDQITPGLLGFVATFAIVIAMFFLIRDMVKRVRRVRYRAQVEEELAGGPKTEHMGIPMMKYDGDIPLGVPVTDDTPATAATEPADPGKG